MENRFRTVEQLVDDWALWAVVGRYGCGAFALLFWFGLVDVTPYSYLSGALRAVLPSYPNADFPTLWELTDWFLGGFVWLLAAAMWVEFVRYRVRILEAGSKEANRQRNGSSSN